jgi:hypothetical protein
MPTLINPRFSIRPLQFSEPDDESTPAEYHFDGYSVEVSQKITLTPITPRHHHHHGHDKTPGTR